MSRETCFVLDILWYEVEFLKVSGCFWIYYVNMIRNIKININILMFLMNVLSLITKDGPEYSIGGFETCKIDIEYKYSTPSFI